MDIVYKNPFTPRFGSIPLQLAGRDELISNILGGLSNEPGDPNRSTIFVGARGTGKTVLLAKIAEEASAKGWICVNVNAEADMLDEVLVQVRDNAIDLLSDTVSFAHIRLTHTMHKLHLTFAVALCMLYTR